MGIYLDPGNQNFAEVLRADIYVDKTMMLSALNRMIDTGSKYVCISRPRRFGKTVTGNMLCAYYSRGCSSGSLFAPFKIASVPGFEEKLNRYHVIKVDVSSEYQNTRDKNNFVIALQEKIKQEMRETFPSVVLPESDTLAESILKVYARTQEQFIVLMDEYDILVREKVGNPLFEEYLMFLNGLFKSDTLRPALALVYLTGILPIVRDKVQSKLNNFREYTFLDAGILSEYVGFTESEVKELCARHGLDFQECRRWYDGYHLGGFDIYNPESVVMAIERRGFDNYWSMTSTYEVVAERIRENYAGTREDVISMISGEAVELDAGMYTNTVDSFRTRSDIFTYLVHLGYLAYDRTNRTCRIPNREVQQEWVRAISVESEYTITNEIIASSRRLLEDTLRGDEEAVAAALDRSHIHVCSNRSYNNEDALQSAIYLAYLYALNRYTVIREMTTGKGFADVVFIPYLPNLPAMIIELKRNGSPEGAIGQIREKRYFESLALYRGDLLFVGINYDEKEKRHTCRIEKFVKS